MSPNAALTYELANAEWNNRSGLLQGIVSLYIILVAFNLLGKCYTA
jgi:hypothetical protein